MKVSFLNSAGKPESWKYQGGSWAVANFIKEADGGNKILTWVTDAATTRKQVSANERKAGMQISYKPDGEDWVNEQYVGTSFTDTEWAKDTNWVNLKYRYDVFCTLIPIPGNINRIVSDMPKDFVPVDGISFKCMATEVIWQNDRQNAPVITLSINSNDQYKYPLYYNNKQVSAGNCWPKANTILQVTYYQGIYYAYSVEPYENLENLYNLSVCDELELTIDGTLDINTGEEVSSNNTKRTDFLTDKNVIIKSVLANGQNDYVRLCFYDEDKQFIKGYIYNDTKNRILMSYHSTIYYKVLEFWPENAMYYRIARSGSVRVYLKSTDNNKIYKEIQEEFFDVKNVAEENKIFLANCIRNPFDYIAKIGRGVDDKGLFFQAGGATTKIYSIDNIPNNSAFLIDKVVAGSFNISAVSFFKGEPTEEGAVYISTHTVVRYVLSAENIIVKKEDIPEDATMMFVSYSSASVSTGYDTNVYRLTLDDILNRISKVETNISNANFSEGLNVYGAGDSIMNIIDQALWKINDMGGIDGREFTDMAVGGESTLDTLMRLDVCPITVLPFTIPAGTVQSSPVEIIPSLYLKAKMNDEDQSLTYYSTYANGLEGDLGKNNEEGISPWDTLKCEIAGVKGTLYFKRSNGNRPNNYFIRDEEGEEVELDRPWLAKRQTHIPKQAWVNVFMGTNGGWTPAYIDDEHFNDKIDVLVNYYRLIKDWLSTNNFLFLGFYATAAMDQAMKDDRINRWAYFEKRMQEEFGVHYYSVRDYIIKQGWRDAGYKLGYRLKNNGDGTYTYTCYTDDIEEDKTRIEEGQVPLCVLSDGIHLRSKVGHCVANQIIKRMYELGFLSEIKQIDINTISDANGADVNNPDYGVVE